MRLRPAWLILAWVVVTAVLTGTIWLAVQLVVGQVGGRAEHVLSARDVHQALTPTGPASTSGPNASRTGSPTPSSTATPRGGDGGAPGAASHSRAFGIQGGTVAATCTRAAVSLRSASPSNGWRVAVHDRGPQRLDVTFTSHDGGTDVVITCSQGVPVAQVVRTHHDGGGGHDHG